MSKTEYDIIVCLMKCGALPGIDTGRLDGKCEDVIPLEDAIAIVDLVYQTECEDVILLEDAITAVDLVYQTEREE